MGIFITLLIGLVVIVLAGWLLTMPKQDVRGIWQTQGHNIILNITPFVIEQYESSRAGTVRALRIPASSWLLERAAEAKLQRDGDKLLIDAGSLTPFVAERIDQIPSNLVRNAGPEATFEIFWHAMNENYAFFDLHKVDWQARYAEFRPQVNTNSSDDELFDIISASMAGLDDRHVSLRGNNRTFSPGAKPKWITTEKMSQQVFPYNDVTDGYLQGNVNRIQETAVVYGWLTNDVGYVRFDRMTSEAGSGEERTRPIREAMTQVAAEFQNAKALIVDVRHNPGGSDDHAFVIAEQFTSERQFALTKSTRDGNGYTEPDTIYLEPTGTASFKMPVFLLTSEVTFSAAEIFSWLMADLPQVTVVGERSGGGMSDILSRTLPNGWEVGLSNQRYLRQDGSSYEGVGIPVDIVREVNVDGFEVGRDTLLEEVMAMVP